MNKVSYKRSSLKKTHLLFSQFFCKLLRKVLFLLYLKDADVNEIHY